MLSTHFFAKSRASKLIGTCTPFRNGGAQENPQALSVVFGTLSRHAAVDGSPSFVAGGHLLAMRQEQSYQLRARLEYPAMALILIAQPICGTLKVRFKNRRDIDRDGPTAPEIVLLNMACKLGGQTPFQGGYNQ